MADCPFCAYAEHWVNPGTEYNVDVDVDGRTVTFDRARPVMWFEPLNPVTPGHMLFVPTYHAESRAAVAAAAAWRCAYDYATTGDRSGVDFNIIVNAGEAATQTIDHLHVHYVPRRRGDGLTLPWTGQATS
ncbi:HIT domain-containing protein [Gordonia sp. PDNC005]|uniref:HIT domain-containing protein n=1 Tax=Gordonia sp. PDNC005 TaxID=2811424 RepID=UPI0019656AF2|nr:HIT domain-containing protein [Gordonia sp. PDNC005]QRY62726.1 HIT domain-containing protein [Gordonia sp. PDNC005]